MKDKQKRTIYRKATKTFPLSVRITQESGTKVKNYSKQHSKSVSETVEQIIKEWEPNERSNS